MAEEKEKNETGITDPAITDLAKAVKKKDAPEKFFIVNEGALNALLAGVSKLPWVDANPLIGLIQSNFKEAGNDS